MSSKSDRFHLLIGPCSVQKIWIVFHVTSDKSIYYFLFLSRKLVGRLFFPASFVRQETADPEARGPTSRKRNTGNSPQKFLFRVGCFLRAIKACWIFEYFLTIRPLFSWNYRLFYLPTKSWKNWEKQPCSSWFGPNFTFVFSSPLFLLCGSLIESTQIYNHRKKTKELVCCGLWQVNLLTFRTFFHLSLELRSREHLLSRPPQFIPRLNQRRPRKSLEAKGCSPNVTDIEKRSVTQNQQKNKSWGKWEGIRDPTKPKQLLHLARKLKECCET